MSGVNDDCYVYYYIQQQNTSVTYEPFLSTFAPTVKQWWPDDSSLMAGSRYDTSPVCAETLLSIKQSYVCLLVRCATQIVVWNVMH